MVAGGITGTFLLLGICVASVFVTDVSGALVPYVGHIYSKWTLDGIYAVYIAAGSVGFVVGCLIAKRHSHIIRQWYPLAIVLGIPMILCLWVAYEVATHFVSPRNMKLADYTNNTIKVNLKVPKGHGYYLELATPEVRRMPNGTSISSYIFSGHVRISSGAASIADFPISSDRALLTSSGFILTGWGVQNTNSPPLSRFIRSQADYDIEITFDPPPPPSSSVWLHWQQAAKDRDR